MDLAALALWVLTALGGLYLAGIAARSGRTESTARTSNLPSAAIVAHGTLAVVGLAAWAWYLRVDEEALGWSIVGLLVLVVGGGLFMLQRWWRDRSDGADQRLAEQQIPGLAVAAHGLLAALTVAAVLVTVLV